MIENYFSQLNLPKPNSHKGQNGKAMIIGGSDLFHAASQWDFRVISRLVDMTFYASVAENNDLLHDAKFYGQDGVIIKRADISAYLEEIDSVLIGPGMRRDVESHFLPAELEHLNFADLAEEDWETDTASITSVLLRHAPRKAWVIDAGALQLVQPAWLPENAVLTPHLQEFTSLLERWNTKTAQQVAAELEKLQADLEEMAGMYFQEEESLEPLIIEGDLLEKYVPGKLQQHLCQLASESNNATFIMKGQADLIWNHETVLGLVGGNAGLTKGGTGDVLAGLITGFRANSPALASVVSASYLNKLAGHQLWQERKTMFNTSDLVEKIPLVFAEIL